MKRYEYKVVKVPIKGFFKRVISPDLENILNEHGRDGWKLADSAMRATNFGESDRLVLIFMREH
jgi:hypothetical protein